MSSVYKIEDHINYIFTVGNGSFKKDGHGIIRTPRVIS